MNEFERRFLEVAQNHEDFKRALADAGIFTYPEYRGYVMTFGAFASNVTQTQVLAIEADAAFILQYITVGVILPNGSTNGSLARISNSANVTFQLTETGSGQTLFNQPVSAGLTAGSPLPGAPGIPFLLPIPRYIPPNTNLKADLTNLGETLVTNPLPVAAYVVLNGTRVQGA